MVMRAHTGRGVPLQRHRPEIRRRVVLFAVVCLIMCLIPVPAFAYVGPGSWSLLAQLILGGLAGLLVVLRVFWSRIKSILLGWVPRLRSKK